MRLLTTAALLLFPTVVLAQPSGGSTFVALDLKKVPVGAWAEYSTTMGQMNTQMRWALVERGKGDHTLEMAVEGGPTAMMGGKLTMLMVIDQDPTKAKKPIKDLVMQIGDKDPMKMPTDTPQVQSQKFEKPDPKKLVGKETIKVAGGSFKTKHYRDKTDRGTVDVWVSEEVPPFGLVKMTLTPIPGATGPGALPFPVTTELSKRGKDAKKTITKPAVPFDPAKMGAMMGGGGPPGGSPPAPPPTDPSAKPAKPAGKPGKKAEK